MKKKLSIIFSFLSLCLFGQVGFQKKASSYSAKEYEKGFMQVYYELNFVKDKKKSDIKTLVITVLQIGEHYSLFSEADRSKRDSILEATSKKSVADIQDFYELRKYKNLFRSVVLKKHPQDSLVVQNYAGKNFEYHKKQPAFQWTLSNESKDILGMTAKKATMEYAGRKDTAWYSTDLSMNNGPYVFSGLPGLILEIVDSKNHYHFKAIGILKEPNRIYLRDDLIKTTEKKFKQAEQGFYDNPSIVYGEARNEDGSIMKAKSLPYNPIELK